MLKFGTLGPLIPTSDSGEVSVPGVRLQWRPLRLQHLLMGGKEPVSGDRQADDIAPPKYNNVDPVAKATGGERPLWGRVWTHSVVVALYCLAARPGLTRQPAAPTSSCGGTWHRSLRRTRGSRPSHRPPVSGPGLDRWYSTRDGRSAAPRPSPLGNGYAPLHRHRAVNQDVGDAARGDAGRSRSP